MLLAISCTKENTANHSSKVAQSTDKILTFHIGQHYGGGIIFYIDSTGQHGLIADTADLPQSKWWKGLSNTGAKGIHINTGFRNTKKIVLSQGDTLNYAALRCWNYKGAGYKDWFLPSKDELNELYLHQNVVGGFNQAVIYWSSSEYDISRGWAQYFSNGNQFNIEKHYTSCVRAVRAF